MADGPEGFAQIGKRVAGRVGVVPRRRAIGGGPVVDTDNLRLPIVVVQLVNDSPNWLIAGSAITQYDDRNILIDWHAQRIHVASGKRRSIAVDLR